jgi:hypothetical protein
VLYPWGSQPPVPDPYEEAQRAKLSEVAKRYADEVYAVHSEGYEPQQSIDLYPASGTMGDWVWGTLRHNVPTLTIELRPRAFFGSSGFQLPESFIQPTWQENRPAILAVLEEWLESAPEPQREAAMVRYETNLESLRLEQAMMQRELDQLGERINVLQHSEPRP